MKKREGLRKLYICILAISFLLAGCGKGNDENTTGSGAFAGASEEGTSEAGKYDESNKARAADVESAKLISAAVYDALADEKVFNEVYDSLDGKILAWASEGQRFEDGGAGHERFLMVLNNNEKLSGGTPMLQYKEQLLGTGNFVPEGWAVTYVGGKVQVYVVGKIYDWGVKDFTDKVQVYPDTDDNYQEKKDTGDIYRDAKDADIRSAGDMVSNALGALASEAAYNEVSYELRDGTILAWAKEGGEFEDGGRGYTNFVKELNESYRIKGGAPKLQYKEKIKDDVEFVPAGWAVAFQDGKPVIYITDGTMSIGTMDTAPKVEMQPNVSFYYK